MRFLLFLLLFLFSAAQADAPPRWTASYETPWRTVTIDVTPTVPQLEALPVLTVQPAYWEPTATGPVSWTASLIHPEQGGDAFEWKQESGQLAQGNFRQESVFHYARWMQPLRLAPTIR